MNLVMVSLSVVALSFLIAYVSVSHRLRVISRAFSELFVTYTALRELVDNKYGNLDPNQQEDIHKENFIKFLSDSRDWAFEYIEDVQSGLDKFINDIEPEINYFDEYGVVGSAYPHYYSMKKISESYKELKKLLPEDSTDGR